MQPEFSFFRLLGKVNTYTDVIIYKCVNKSSTILKKDVYLSQHISQSVVRKKKLLHVRESMQGTTPEVWEGLQSQSLWGAGLTCLGAPWQVCTAAEAWPPLSLQKQPSHRRP